MRWLIAVLMALSFTFAGAVEINAADMPADHDVQLHAHTHQSAARCHTAGDLCCAHAISCCVVLTATSARALLQAIDHSKCVDAGAQLLVMPVPRPPPKFIARSF